MSTRIFFERDSLEAKRFIAFLERESPACEVLLVSDPEQGALLATKLRVEIIVIQGGLSDGRAQALLDRLAPAGFLFQWVVSMDRRPSQGALSELALEKAQERLRPCLGRGWLLLKFLDAERD